MRTEAEVEDREVLAIWMKGTLKYVSQTSYNILSAFDGGRTQSVTFSVMVAMPHV